MRRRSRSPDPHPTEPWWVHYVRSVGQRSDPQPDQTAMVDTTEPLFDREATDDEQGPDHRALGDPDELGLVIFLTEQQDSRRRE